ncbi:uncharacterized protein [Argopecten irradians]|uniref:uncharacterized protein isoform X1 n=1 Tax=Argopecten irradians TaxID=31199 RepID=UPI00371FEEC0
MALPPSNREIYFNENDIVQSEIDESGNLVFYLMPGKSSQQSPTTDLMYNLVNEQGHCQQIGASSTVMDSHQLMAHPDASVSLATKGTDYQYTAPATPVQSYQVLPSTSNSNKVLVERVNSVEHNPPSSFSSTISADMLNSTNTDIFTSNEAPQLGVSATGQVNSYPSDNHGNMMSFANTYVSLHSQTLQVQPTVEEVQLLSHLSAETLESLQSIFDVDVDNTITTTTDELLESALEPTEHTTISSQSNSLQTLQSGQGLRLTPKKQSSSPLRRSKRISLKSYDFTKYTYPDEEPINRKEQKKLKKQELTGNEVFMSPEDASIVKKSVSNYRPDFSSYPEFCRCVARPKGTDIPVEQIWLHHNQMYYLPQISIMVISYEEFVGFLRKDVWYVSVGEITHRLIPKCRNEVESYLIKNVCDKQFLSPEEIEYLKQRKCVNQGMKSGIMISLRSFRVMCKELLRTKSFIQAPTTGLSNAAHGNIYRKLFEMNTRCSKCGGAVEDAKSVDRYILIDVGVEAKTCNQVQAVVQQGVPVEKSMHVGEVAIAKVFFQCFKLEELTYISLKEIVECQMFSLQVLQSRLVQLQYRPRPAPASIDYYFSNVCSIVSQTLWIDLMTLRCVCCMSRLRSPTANNEILQQLFSRGQYTCSFNREIIAIDDYDSANNDTVYTLDPHTYKITTRHNYTQATGTGQKDEKKQETDVKCELPLMKPKSKKMNPGKVTKVKCSPPKLESQLSTLKPGVYYFSDKNSIVDFLKDGSEDVAIPEKKQAVTDNKMSYSNSVQFQVRPAPNKIPHLLRNGIRTSNNLAKKAKRQGMPKRGFKRKLKEVEMDRNMEYLRNDSCREEGIAIENDVSSSVPFNAPLPSSLCGQYESCASGSNIPSKHHFSRSAAESPEVQNKNVDSTATNNIEEEFEYSHNGIERLSSESITYSEKQGNTHLEMQGNHDDPDELQLDMEDFCSDNDMEEESSYLDADDKANNNVSYCKTSSAPKHTGFSSPDQLSSKCPSIKSLSTSTPQPSSKGNERTPRKTPHSSGSASQNISVEGRTSNYEHPFSDVQPSSQERLSLACDGNTSLSPFKFDISDSALEETGKTGLFSTPCSSPILDRKFDKKGKTPKMERLYNKCALLDTSSGADESLHVLATVATDLETLDETSSQSNSSERLDPSVLDSEINKDNGVGSKVATKRDILVQFLRQIVQDIEVSNSLSSGSRVLVKFQETAKHHYPALWNESGQTRLKKLAKLLALSVPFSPTKEFSS